MQSPELLLNIKSIPDKHSQDYDAFWDNERKKCEYGVTINGVFISPWLYFHTQLWNIYIDTEDKINKAVKRTFMHPNFRDNEWIISDSLERAKLEKKGVMIFGSRRLGKSEFLSSHIGQSATLFQGSENVIMGGNWGDIDVITYKLTQGLNGLPDYFKFGRLTENLRKEIELGFKDKRGTRISWSKIIVRNHEEGIKTEAAAGLTATSFVIDEVGKSSFAQVFESAKPAFTSPFGWRCVPILTGTSGDIKKSSDAEKFFMNPEAHNFIVTHLQEEANVKVSVFISGLRRMEGKVKTTLANYIETEKGILVPKDSELYKVPFENSDFDLANSIIDKERDDARKSPDPTALLKATMYYPKDTKELFLQDTGNNFPIEAINEQIAFLTHNADLQGVPIDLFRSVNNKVIYKNSSKKPVSEFPIKRDTLIDAPILMYEPPVEDVPIYTYISGCDPYNQSQATSSDSLGTVYIYKRMYDPINGTFQRRVVASYAGRTATMKEWHENVEMLLELYNAVCLPENEAGTFIQYFDAKNKGHLLADGYSFLKEITPSTNIVGRTKGLPATPGVQKYYKALVYDYCTEQVQVGTDSLTGEPLTKLGVFRITDIMLLRELLAFVKGGNFDRYIAFGHTLAHEVWADKMYPLMSNNESIYTKQKSTFNPKIATNSPFGGGSSSPFGGNRSTNFFPTVNKK